MMKWKCLWKRMGNENEKIVIRLKNGLCHI